jgi:Tfp pilus assembly protein PilF
MRQAIVIIYILLTVTTVSCQSLDKPGSTRNDKDHFETRKQIVINSLDNGQPAQALHDAKALAESKPGDASVMNLLGLANMALKNSDKAIESLQRAHDIEPANMTYVLNLSSALIQARQFTSATDLLNRVIRSDAIEGYKFRERIYHNLGLAAEMSGKSERAENYYNKALAENPTNFLTLIKLSQIYERTHRRILAADKLETARAACPRCIEPVESLVRIYMSQGKPNIARSVVESLEKNEGLTDQETKRILRLKKIVSRGNTQTRS